MFRFMHLSCCFLAKQALSLHANCKQLHIYAALYMMYGSEIIPPTKTLIHNKWKKAQNKNNISRNALRQYYRLCLS